MIIDGHAHIGTYSKFYPLRIRTVDQTIDAMDRAGVDKMVASHLESFCYDPESGNRRLKDDIARYPDRFIPFFNVHPRYVKQASDEIMCYAGDLGWRGLKLHPEYQKYKANCIEVKRVIEQAAKYNCVVLYHSGDDFVGSLCSPLMIADVAKDFPETPFIMGHMGVSDWPGAIEAASECENIILDATTCIANYGMVEYAVKFIGKERIIWGSDFPFYPLELGLSKIIDSELDEESKQFILGPNIERIMKNANN